MRWTAPRKQEAAHLIRHGSAMPPSPHRGRPLARCTPKAPLSGADSPYQGEMSRRDKRGRDAVSRRLTERLSQICCNLSVSAHAEPPPLKGEAFFCPKKINFPKSLPFSHRHVTMAQRPSTAQRDIPLFCLRADRICRLKGKSP